MSERALKRLVGALVIVVLLWAATRLLAGGSGAIGASGEIAGFFDGMSADAVEVVRITDADGSRELRLGGGQWTANGFDADSAAVQRMLAALYDMGIGDLAATNPANHGRMGVSADRAISFEVVVAGDTRSLLVGDQGPRFGTAYARLPDQDEVYVLEGDLRVHLTRTLTDWRDKELVAVDTTRVARIEVEREGEGYTVVRGDSVWAFEDGGDVDQVQLRGMLTELSGVVASGFLTESDSLYAQPPAGFNRAYDAEGGLLAEVTLGAGETERWARTPGDSIVYRLSTFRVGRLAPRLDEITPES